MAGSSREMLRELGLDGVDANPRSEPELPAPALRSSGLSVRFRRVANSTTLRSVR